MPISPETIRARKAALVSAAHDLIKEKRGASFSMRELALKAGVSATTPYNLLGTKTNLLRLVVEMEFAQFRAKLPGLKSTAPLDRLLEAVDLLAIHYGSDQDFYFGFMRSASTIDDGALGPILLQEARTLYRELMSGIFADTGAESLDQEIVTDIFLRALRATVEAWYVDGWEFDRFRDEFGYTARLVLFPVLDGNHRATTYEQLLDIQKRLSAFPREAPSEPLHSEAG